MGEGVRGGLVGRLDELALLEKSLAVVRSGRSQIVLIEGEPGIGKTALLRQWARDGADATVVWASGDPAESGLEFGVVRQLLAGLPGQTRPQDGWDSAVAGAALLAGISALEELAPVVAVVADDLHWADPPSVRALLFCLRRLEADPVLVLLAARPEARGHLGESWERLAADTGRVRRVRLAGLTPAEVRTLAAGADRELTAEAAVRLQQHTAGNPLYVSALLAEVPDEALRGERAPLPAPRVYAATVLARLSRLPGSARQLVCAAAVLGVRGRFRLAAAMAGPADGTAAVDEAVTAGLLNVRGGPGAEELVFAHPLARAAVYEDLPPSLRRTLHLAAAGMLPAPASFSHRVAAAAGAFDSGLAAELIEAAQDASAAGAPRQAAQYLAWASQVDADPGRAERSLFDAVWLALLAGDVHAAGELADAVDACAPSPRRRLTQAFLAAHRGWLEHGAAELRSLAETLSPDDDADLFGSSTAALALLCAALGDDEAALLWAQRAQAVAGHLPAVRALALHALTWSYAKTGQISEALALLAGCSPRQPASGSFDAELLTIRGVVRNWAGDFAGATEDLTAVLRWQREGAPTYGITNAYSALAEAEFRSGDWGAAAIHVETGISLGEDLDHVSFLAYARAVAALLSAARGDDSSAAAHAAAAQEAARACPSMEALACAALARAHCAWARADWPAVIEALAPVEAGACGTAARYPNLAIWRYRLAEAYLATGRAAEAQRLLGHGPAEPWGGVTGADRARLNALAWLQAGHPDRAAAAFAAAMPDPDARSLAGGLLALDYGRLLLQLKKRKAAAEAALTARSILAGLGAPRLAGACDRVLLAAGAAPVPRQAGQGALSSPERLRLDELTAREQAVARLVGSGMTNREVAAELYVSVKAVEYHLSSVFAKLGIRSRRELPVSRSDSLPGPAHPRKPAPAIRDLP